MARSSVVQCTDQKVLNPTLTFPKKNPKNNMVLLKSNAKKF